MNEQTYPSDLTDEEWEWIKDMIPAAKRGGRPRTLCMRAVLNAIFYVTKGGSQWRMLPTNFPKWQSVYHYLRVWKLQGVWVRIHDTLRARVRAKEARHKHPTAGCLDSQSVKTTEVGGPERGFDNGKQVKGRKRHVLVDTFHIPHPFSWLYEGFSRSALKRNLPRPYRSLPGLFSLPLPDVMTGMSPLANLRTDESGRPLSSPSWPPPYGPAPSISVCYGAFGSCACPPHLMRYSEAL